MIHKILFVLLTLVTISACSDCIINDGLYTSFGGNEQTVHLKLLANKTFFLEHEVWYPGDYENREHSNIKGVWSCKHNQIILEVDSRTYRAELTSVGKNPLGINEKTMVLHFGFNKENNYLSNEILYPQPQIAH